MVPGALRVLPRVTDFLMDGIALGDAAIAGLEIGVHYYSIGVGLLLALTSGPISVLSRDVGADTPTGVNRARAIDMARHRPVGPADRFGVGLGRTARCVAHGRFANDRPGE